MTMYWLRRLAGCCLAIAFAGCTGAPPPAGTGAETAVRGFYEALVTKEWAKAHAGLHPESQAKCAAAPFGRKAESFRRQLGFEPTTVVVRSCEEHGDEALAHVVLKGGSRSYKDAIVLRRTAAGWGVLLPAQFGTKH